VLWRALPATDDPISVDLFPRYFQRLYARDLDVKRICEALAPGREGDVRFRDAAESFKLIDEQDAAQVIVRYRSPLGAVDVDALIGKLEAEGPERWLMRKLQRYAVTVYQRDADRLLARGDVRCVARCPGLLVQASDVIYDPETGLMVDGAPGDPAQFFF
jgi:CRISPR-associated endonuclease/helicase Cas3